VSLWKMIPRHSLEKEEGWVRKKMETSNGNLRYLRTWIVRNDEKTWLTKAY
jgi:CRISPR/Cas system Type II protein with McrA/HNH and RuvC-like nuclease domain